jgi:predicted nucleic acid-binding protein
MEQVIGLDTSVFIYLFEEHPEYVKRAEHILEKIERGATRAVFSSIGLIEILTGPKKKERHDLAARYRDIITTFPNLTIQGINERIVEHASDLRARYGIRTPDAIHLATAIDFGARTFFTNDRALKKVKEIVVELL